MAIRRTISVLTIGATLAFGAPGCATIATHDEYRAYRRVREASDDNARLAALQQYASSHPSGIWSAEVTAERARREQEVWAGHNASADGLRFYLSAYPDGTYVQQAQQRLAAVSTVSERRETEQEHVVQLQQDRREQAAVDRRLWVTRAVQFWTRTLLSIRNFGATIGQVARGNPEFSQAFGQEPAPLCDADACLKHYRAHYAIPVPGATRIERQMHVLLRIRLERGRMERVEVLMPNKGFSRWYELENRTMVTDEDPTQRQAAIEWALQRIEPIIAEVGTGSRTIDVIPEPISPISQAQQAASERPEEGAPPAAASAPSTSAPAATPPSSAVPSAQSAVPSAQGAEAGGGIDALLEQAVGGGAVEGPSTTDPAGAAETSEAGAGEALVLPIALRALQRGNVRMVLFAAGDEDYGAGYDGFYIERVRD